MFKRVFKELRNGLIMTLATLIALTSFTSLVPSVSAADNKITDIKATGVSEAGKEAKYAVDGDRGTYYLTPDEKSFKDHYRYIDLELDGMYEISEIKVFNLEGSYNNYQIYASKDGDRYDKIAYKSNEEVATLKGDVHSIDNVKASFVRINLSYNSAQFQGNLVEVELYGNKIGKAEKADQTINVPNFNETQWAVEHQKFVDDKNYANEKIIKEIKALVGRVIGEKWVDSFEFEIREPNSDGHDVFEIENGDNNTIIIRGNSGVALASGFNHYLRYYCNVNYTPLFASNLQMPSELPRLEEKIIKETEFDIRYALNFCTYSYTMAFWGWEEFEEFLDWAAMSGINSVLDIVGQEEVLRRTLSKFGYTDEEIKEYIVGPGYFAWFYMQNMTSYGGKLPNSWFSERVELGRQMHDRMQAFGITPILSGYSGMVPRSFKTKHTDVEYIGQGTWNGSGYERPDMIRTYTSKGGRDYFQEVADEFYKAQKDIFGDVTSMYSVDPFHEGGSMGNMNATKVYETIQKKMLEHDKDAVWIIQEWSGSIASNLSKLTNLDKDHVIVLDLNSEIKPQGAKLEEAKTPWVWNMLHNFGGRMGLDGNPERVSQEVSSSFNSFEYMKGIGMTPEAIENSPMLYELLFDTTWTKDPIDLGAWIEKYAERNYGGTNADIKEAWKILIDTVYSPERRIYQGAPESVFNARPQNDFVAASAWGQSKINYDKAELERALGLLIKHYDEFKGSDAYIYDVADITRQVMSNTGLEFYRIMDAAHKNYDSEAFTKAALIFLDLIKIQDEVLSTNEAFLVGPWIDKSRSMMSNADDWTKDLFEYNARSLITTWGSYGQANGYFGGGQSTAYGLADYSNRQWAGLTKDFYYPRWELFVMDTIEAFAKGGALPSFNSYNWFMIESQWSTKKSDEGFSYTLEPSGANLKEISTFVLENYSSKSAEEYDTVQHKDKINIALGKTASLKTEGIAVDPERPVKNLTDGSKETSFAPADKLPSKRMDIWINLGGSYDIDSVEITMIQTPDNLPYNIQIDAWTNNWKTIGAVNKGVISSNEVIEAKGTATWLNVIFTTDDAEAKPNIFEIQVYGKKTGTVVEEVTFTGTNYALGRPSKVINRNGENISTKLTDGDLNNLENVGRDIFPTTFQVDLEAEKIVKDIRVHFEKAGIRFQFDVVVEDESGNKTTILDMNDNMADLDRTYVIPYEGKVRKILVTINGRAKGGSFYAASPAVAEIEAFNEPPIEVIENSTVTSNIDLSEEEKNALIDRDNSTVLNLLGKNDEDIKEFVFDLKEKTEVYALEILTEEKNALNYLVEIKDGDSDWIIVKNAVSSDFEANRFVQLFKSQNADKVRLTIINDDVKIQSFNVYAYNAAQDLLRVINDINRKIQYKLAGEYPGNYSLELKEALNDELKIGMDLGQKHLTRSEAAKQIDAINLAYRSFLDSYISVDRGKLIVEIYESKGLLKADSLKNFEELMDAYNAAEQVYNTIMVKQIDLDSAVERLIKAKERALEFLNDKEAVEAYIQMAQSLVEEVAIGDRPGNVDEKTSQALIDAIKEAKEAMNNSRNNADLEKIIIDISSAMDTFKKGFVVVDKDALKGAIIEGELEDRSIYTKDSYSKLEKALKDADAILNNEDASISEVKSAIMNIEAAIDSLVELDRKPLEAIISEVEQLVRSKYTKTSWVEMISRFTFAKEVLAKESLNQSDILEAIKNLEESIENLIELDRTPLTEAIEQAQQLNAEEYSEDEWREFLDILREANEVASVESLEQEEIDIMAEKLQEANYVLNKEIITEVKDHINAAIKEAKELVETNEFTEDSVADLEKAIKDASNLIDTDSKSVIDLRNALSNLRESIETLVKKPVDPVDPQKPGVIHGFDGLTRVFQVGEKFTLVPTIDDQEHGNGWIYDKNLLSATFNSPATFTALKEGTTTIEYRSLNGVVEKMTVKIVNKDTKPVLPGTGITNYAPLIGISLLALGISITYVNRRRKEEQ